jgi:H+/gluconate symporter-like permease
VVTTTDGTTTLTAGSGIILYATTTVTSLTTTITTSTTVATTTAAETVTPVYGKRGNDVKTQVPQWACDCRDNSRFSSACACAGFQQQTVTAPAKTVTSIVYATPTTTSFVVSQTTLGGTSKLKSILCIVLFPADFICSSYNNNPRDND